MQLNAVVLPAPFGPISPTISHSLTERESSRSACSPPKRTDTPDTSRTGGMISLPEPAAGQPAHERCDLLCDAAGVEGESQQQQQRTDKARPELQDVGRG